MKQNYAQFIFTLAPVAALAAGVALAVLAWRARNAATRGLAAASAVGQRLATVEHKLKTATQQTSEQARRVAWLELRLRQSKTGALPSDLKASHANRTSMTERRHRVLVLARRGMEPALIAETLGVPKGEVELIISLNSLQAAA